MHESLLGPVTLKENSSSILNCEMIGQTDSSESIKLAGFIHFMFACCGVIFKLKTK